MTSSYSTDLKLELMVTGENAGTWGTKTNTNLNLLQQAIAGYQDISIAGGAQTTALTMDNAAISNARNAVIELTGTITGNQIVTVPTGIEKTYIVENGTTGAFTVEFKQDGGTGTTFATTDKGIKILFADGTNVVDVNANFSASSFPQINDSNGNEEIKFTTTASAVNELTVTNAATGNAPEISATGSDTNIDLKLTPKGTGKLDLDGIKFPNADGSAGQALVTDGSGILSFASAGLAWQSVQTANFTAVAGEAYPVNTTSTAITVTLPATPSAGDQVQVVDYAGTFDNNQLVINPNGEDLEGGTDNLVLRGEREGVILTYIDSTQGWIATSGINEGTNALEPNIVEVDFLVIAGGGGGGSTSPGTTRSGGGGGAGGYRTSAGTSGGGGSAESSEIITVGANFTVTVGAGGPGATSGSNSVFSTITSIGGGRGGNNGNVGALGGSGGGGGSGPATTAGGPGTANQGRAGGTGSGAPGGPFRGGGGGGASSAGGTVNGGAGVASTITGPSTTRAGGGGAGGNTYAGAGTGGAGGGGAGGNNAGTVNTGGGGGGGTGQTTHAGGAGGSGIVILKYPDSFTISNPGGGLTFSTTTSAPNKITSVTAGTGDLQIN